MTRLLLATEPCVECRLRNFLGTKALLNFSASSIESSFVRTFIPLEITTSKTKKITDSEAKEKARRTAAPLVQKFVATQLEGVAITDFEIEFKNKLTKMTKRTAKIKRICYYRESLYASELESSFEDDLSLLLISLGISLFLLLISLGSLTMFFCSVLNCAAAALLAGLIYLR